MTFALVAIAYIAGAYLTAFVMAIAEFDAAEVWFVAALWPLMVPVYICSICFISLMDWLESHRAIKIIILPLNPYMLGNHVATWMRAWRKRRGEAQKNKKKKEES